jgi:hypothetical protein
MSIVEKFQLNKKFNQFNGVLSYIPNFGSKAFIVNEGLTLWKNDIPLAFLNTVQIKEKSYKEITLNYSPTAKKSRVWGGIFMNMNWTNTYNLNYIIFQPRYYQTINQFVVNNRVFFIGYGFIAELNEEEDTIDILFAVTLNYKTKSHKKMYVDFRLIDKSVKYKAMQKWFKKYIYDSDNIELRNEILATKTEIIHCQSINDLITFTPTFKMPKAKSIGEAKKIKEQFINYLIE